MTKMEVLQPRSPEELKEQVYVWSKNKMRQIIDSGNKTFDKQHISFSKGNVWSTTIFGNYIRPYTELSNGFEDRPPGHLQAFDLNYYEKDLPSHIRRYIEDLFYDVGGILYEVRHFYGDDDKKIIHGYLLTSGYDDGHKFLRHWVIGPGQSKSAAVMSCAEKYLCWKE